MIRSALLAVALALCTVTLAAQVTTTAVEGLRTKDVQLVALVNCTVTTEPGTTLDSAVVVIRDERIAAVGRNLTPPRGAFVIDLGGAHVYPAFVEPLASVQALAGKKADTKERPWWEDGDPSTPPADGAVHWNRAIRPERRAASYLSLTEGGIEPLTKNGYAVAAAIVPDGIMRGSATTTLLRSGSAASAIIHDAPYMAASFRKGSSTTPYPSSQMGSIALLRQTWSDARWYADAHNAARRNPRLTPPETNVSLDALAKALTANTPWVADMHDEHDLFRWSQLAADAGVSMVYRATGREYRRLADVARLKPTLIIPFVLPDVPDVGDASTAHNVPLEQLIHWYWAADMPRMLDSVGCTLAFTTDGMKDPSAMAGILRRYILRGLDTNVALAALTTVPARLAGVADRVGRIAVGHYANLAIYDGSMFAEGSVLRSTYVAGRQRVVSHPPAADMRGAWSLTSAALPRPLSLRITGTAAKPSIETKATAVAIPSTLALDGRNVVMTFTTDSLGFPGVIRVTATADSILLSGDVVMPNGARATFVARRDSLLRSAPPAAAQIDSMRRPLPQWLPLGPFGLEGMPPQRDVMLTNATVWTCGSEGVLSDADVHLRDGKIVAVGRGLAQTGGADTVIDCRGMHITPGIIDEHSHIAISRGVNEGTHAITTEVRIGDVVNPDDVNVYRQLAGGVTASHLLHGSANPMGGQLQFIKLRWGGNAEELKVANAVPTVKFALGENVKQANWGDRYTVRYPQTRMGVEEIMRDGFRAAREYEAEMKAADATKLPVRRDYQLDALLEIVSGKRNIHCHSYVQSEILMLMRLAEEYGFRVHTFTHILEGYKVAKEMAAHGAKASSFADWWAYKFEVYDAIPENPAIMHEQGVVVSINSDDAEMARRLNQEAAKSVSYGGVSEEDALKFVTLNAAKQMAIEAETGSLESGKLADVVVWSGNPLSSMSKVLRTYVDGREYFSIDTDKRLRARDAELRAFLEQAALKAAMNGEPSTQSRPRGRRHYHCDDYDDEMTGEAEHE